MAERTLLMVKLISNFARMIPEFDSEKGHHVAMSDSPWLKYPHGFPVVYMEGIFNNNHFLVRSSFFLKFQFFKANDAIGLRLLQLSFVNMPVGYFLLIFI